MVGLDTNKKEQQDSREVPDRSPTVLVDIPHGAQGLWRGRSISPAIVGGLARLWDVMFITLVGVLAFWFYLDANEQNPAYYATAIALGALGVVFIFTDTDLYQLGSVMRPRVALERQIRGILIVFTALVVLTFFLKVSQSFSRVWLALWLAGCLVALPSGRILLANLLSALTTQGALTRNIALYGTGAHAQRFLQRIHESDYDWNRIVGVFDDRQSRHVGAVEGHPVIGSLSILEGFVREHRVDQIVLALPWLAEERIFEIRNRLSQLPVNVGLAPGLVSYSLSNAGTTQIAGVPVTEIVRRPISGWDHVIKRIFDALVSVIVFLLLLPVLGIIALVIRIDSPGDIFFRQKRFGFNNKLIDVFKFRTMYSDQLDPDANQLATKEDPRITRVGHFLRRWSLDELPQVINVVRGEMSLVGPRPHATQAKAADKLYTQLLNNYAARHRVKPGITGWAQIKGWRGETDTEEKLIRRVEHDLWYIENWSLWLDIKIMLVTFKSVIQGENAH